MSPHRRAFTLVELLVVITIIGLLVGMLMPAVQNSRESARRLSCQNNVRQLALACLAHEAAHTFLPTGGWGWGWVGDPDRGFTRSQPGGWQYNILPFLEQAALHDAAAGQPAAQKMQTLTSLTCIALPTFTCPSRRRPIAYPTPSSHPACINYSVPAYAARSDYAANAGSNVPCTSEIGPSSLAAGDSTTYTWNCNKASYVPDGVIFQHSQLRMAEIRDGTACTYLLGERYVDPDHYTDGNDPGDNENLYIGHDQDVVRWTYVGTGADPSTCSLTPAQDTPGLTPPTGLANSHRFGSAHAGALNMAFCDGSVHAVNYTVDPVMHQRMGGRNDGLPVDDTALAR